MANILVNGMKSKVGGGKVIFDTYLKLLCDRGPPDCHFVLTPDRAAYRRYESERIRVIDVPSWAHSNLATLLLYRSVFPKLLAEHRIDAILNFGDVVIPTDVPQLYNFDWAFAVYRSRGEWQNLSAKERVLYGLKLHFFEAYLSHATIIMAQTDAMRSRLEAQYGLTNVVTIPAAVEHGDGQTVQSCDLGLSPGMFTMVYPANYYPHKNIEILEPVAEELVCRGIHATIVTTLSPDEHPGVSAFLDRCRAKGLDKVIVNVGRLTADQIPSLFDASDALLMPTLLETFGLPYVEAMRHARPILTSDRDFAHAVCGDAALYFDPSAPVSIAEAIERLAGDRALQRILVDRGRNRLAGMWDWPRVFDEYQRLIGSMHGTTGVRKDVR